MMQEPAFNITRKLTAISLCVALAGCVTARPTAPADLEILTMALTQPVLSLQERAESGQARAQYALALVYAYGLHGADPGQSEAARWRQRGLSARGYTPITTYIAGLDGKPGRVSTINVPRYDLNGADALRNDQCARVLSRAERGSAAAEACAGPEELARLQFLWASAVAD